MSQDLFTSSHGFNSVPRGEERTALRLYLKYADKLLQRFNEWNGIDRFYFIPIKLNMAFFCLGGATAIAYPPYFIGTILRNSLEHPDLFGTKCQCGQQAYGYSYNGSPLSGRVDISSACHHCGTHIETMESGWKIRSNTLRESQKKERWRIAKIRLLHPRFQPATIQELLKFIGLSDEDLALPLEERKITRTDLGNGSVCAEYEAVSGSIYSKLNFFFK